MYINDLADICIQDVTDADDAKIYKHVFSKADQDQLQMSLSKLHDWSNTWLLSLNVRKCKVVSYGRHADKNYYKYKTRAQLLPRMADRLCLHRRCVEYLATGNFYLLA